MKLKSAIAVVALTLVCLGLISCDQTNTNLPVRGESETPLETTTPTQWQPKHDTEGQLRVQVESASARINLVSLGEQDGILPVKIEVLDFGHNNGNPNNREAGSAWLRLERPRFISQAFRIDELNREVTQVLVRVSFEPAKIHKSFERAAQAYRMPVAYPTYIPWGYELDVNEFHAGLRGETDEQPRGTWFLSWARGVSPVEWSDGSSSITMRFSPFPEDRDGVTQRRPTASQWRQRLTQTNGRFRPEKFRTVKVDDRINAQVSSRRAAFFVDGLWQSGEISFQDVSRTEAEKIVKGMRFVEYDEKP